MLRRRRLAEALAVLLLFTLLVCTCTWPLVSDLSTYLPRHWDPRLMAWTMATNSRQILSNPLLLFHGNSFYPYGSTKAFSEVLIVPSLVSLPVFLLSGNPVLSYNVTLLLLWSLSGLAMYLCAREMVGHKWGALLAATIWTISPYRTDYYREFNMQMCFAAPLVLLFWQRFLRTQKAGAAALTLVFLGIQALSCWTYAIMVSLYLAVFTAAFALLRQRGWRIKRVLSVIPLLVVFGAAMFPFAEPYFRIRSELGIERRLSESVDHSADILTYIESGPVRTYHFRPTAHRAETSLFPGFVAVLFSGLSLAYFFEKETGVSNGRTARIIRFTVAAGLLLSLLQFGLRVGGIPIQSGFIRTMRLSTASVWAIALSLALLLLRGRCLSRTRFRERVLFDKDLLGTFLFALLVMFFLSLGPVVHVKRQAVGHGIYYHLYGLMFPLRAIRVVTRFGAFALFSIAILSALGVKWFHAAIGQRWRLIGALICGAFLLAFLEYCPWRLNYQRFPWKQRPHVYDAVASDPDDFAIAEWPFGWRVSDGSFLLWSVAHKKRILGGTCHWGGILPPRTERIRITLTELTNPERTDECIAELRAIYPTKYLILHRRLLPPGESWRPWKNLLQNLPDGLALIGVFDGDYLLGITPVVERGREFSREFSYEHLLRHNVARFRLRDVFLAPEGGLVKILFNDAELCQDTLAADWKEYELKLPGPYRKAAPNCIRIASLASGSTEGQIEFNGFSLCEK